MLNQQKNNIINQSGGIKFYEASPQFGKQSTEFKEQPHLIGEHFVRSEVLFAEQDTCESIYDKYLANEQINQESQFQNIVNVNDPITQFNINDIMYPQTNEQQFRSIRQENFDDSLENLFSFEEVKTDSPQRILQPLQMFQQQEHQRVYTYQPNQRVYEYDFGQLRVAQGNNEDTPNFRLIERRFPVVEQLRHNLQHERQLLQQERIQYQQERMDFQQQRMEFVPPNHIHHQRIRHDRPQIQQNHHEINRRIREISENRVRDYQEFRQPTSFRSNPFQRYSPFDVRPQQHERRQLSGLDQNEVLMLTEINFIESKCRGWEEKDKKCSICLSEFQTNEKIRFLPCLHRFHSSCIDKWLKSNAKCPLCKKDIKILIKEMNGHHL